jgi:tripartite-type tricarboxylate transporter receptor subunit TctC
MKTRSLFLNMRALVVCALGIVCGAHAQAQDYRGAIRVLVGYPPGGPADTVARIVADKLPAQLGQPVFVENRPGAGGLIAAQQLKSAPADGSTLFLSNTHTVAMIPLINKAAGISPSKDFRTVGSVASFELALAAHPSTGAANFEQLGRWFVKNPSRVSIGVPAAGSVPELLAVLVARRFQTTGLPVAYKGATPMVQDLLGGQVSSGISAVSDFLQYQQTGRLRIVAVTQATPLLPGVPTFKDAGLQGVDFADLLGLYAPSATPTLVVARYNAALQRVLADPEVQEKLRALAMAPLPGTPAEHANRLARISNSMAAAVRAVGYAPQ